MGSVTAVSDCPASSDRRRVGGLLPRGRAVPGFGVSAEQQDLDAGRLIFRGGALPRPGAALTLAYLAEQLEPGGRLPASPPAETIDVLLLQPRDLPVVPDRELDPEA